MAKQKYRGLFFFWDSMGLPLEISIRHLQSKGLLPEKRLHWLIMEFILDAWHAGWSDKKIKSDLREADRCGGLELARWMTKLYDD